MCTPVFRPLPKYTKSYSPLKCGHPAIWPLFLVSSVVRLEGVYCSVHPIIVYSYTVCLAIALHHQLQILSSMVPQNMQLLLSLRESGENFDKTKVMSRLRWENIMIYVHTCLHCLHNVVAIIRNKYGQFKEEVEPSYWCWCAYINGKVSYLCLDIIMPIYTSCCYDFQHLILVFVCSVFHQAWSVPSFLVGCIRKIFIMEMRSVSFIVVIVCMT